MPFVHLGGHGKGGFSGAGKAANAVGRNGGGRPRGPGTARVRTGLARRCGRAATRHTPPPEDCFQCGGQVSAAIHDAIEAMMYVAPETTATPNRTITMPLTPWLPSPRLDWIT